MAEIKAEFILDSEGKPKFISDGRNRHYEILLKVDDAPEEAIGVTFKLDESYYDPLREAYRADTGFAEEITSYGDYEISATVRTKLPEEIRSSLSDALERNYGTSADNNIQAALRDIKRN